MSEPVLTHPLVSVVVTTYNRVGLLRETIESILAQTYRDFELLVVDNLSADGTADYINGIDDARIRYFRNGNGGLVAVNRNFGIDKARGRYVAFCDDDDLWLPTKLERQVARMEAAPSIALTCTGMVLLQGERTRPHHLWFAPAADISFARMLLGNPVGTSSVVVRKDVLPQPAPFDQEGSLSPYEDYELWLRIAFRHRIVRLPEDLVVYRIHGACASPDRVRRQALVLKVLFASRARLGFRSPWFWIGIAVRQAKLLAARFKAALE